MNFSRTFSASASGDVSKIHAAHAAALLPEEMQQPALNASGQADGSSSTAAASSFMNSTLVKVAVVTLDAAWAGSGGAFESHLSVQANCTSCRPPAGLRRALHLNGSLAHMPHCGNAVFLYSVQLALAAVGSEHAIRLHGAWLHTGGGWRPAAGLLQAAAATAAWALLQPLEPQQPLSRCDVGSVLLSPSLAAPGDNGSFLTALHVTLSLPALALLGGPRLAASLAAGPASDTARFSLVMNASRVFGAQGVREATAFGAAPEQHAALVPVGSAALLAPAGPATSISFADSVNDPTSMCAVSGQGGLHCAGRNDHGQLGRGHMSDSAFFAPVLLAPAGGGAAAKQVALGNQHACAIVLDSAAGAWPQVKCWGRAQHGQTGSGATSSAGGSSSSTPGSLPAVHISSRQSAPHFDFPVQVSASYDHSCALLSSGRLACFGRNNHGQLGYDSTDELSESHSPAQRGGGNGAEFVALPGPVAAVAAARWHTCALLRSGAVHCWGRGSDGQNGAGTGNPVGDTALRSVADASAVALPGGEAAVQVAAYALHSCALLVAGGVSCWGNGGSGRLGQDGTADIGLGDTPADHPPVDLREGAVSVSLGLDHSCAALESGAVKCWGLATFGRLGPGVDANVGDDPSRSVGGAGPIQYLRFAAEDVVSGSRSTCVWSATGVLRCWGSSNGIPEFPTVPFDPFSSNMRYVPSANSTVRVPVVVNAPFTSRHGSAGVWQRTLLYTHGLSSRDVLQTRLVGPAADFELAWVRTQIAVAGLPATAEARYPTLQAPQVSFALESLSGLSRLQAVPRWLGFAALAGVRRSGIPQLPAALYATCARGGLDATEAEVPLSGIGYAACLWPDTWHTGPQHVLFLNGTRDAAGGEGGVPSTGGLVSLRGQFWPLVLLAPQGVGVLNVTIAGQSCTSVRIVCISEIACVAPPLSGAMGNVSQGADMLLHHSFVPEAPSPLPAFARVRYAAPLLQSASHAAAPPALAGGSTIVLKGVNLGAFISKPAALAAPSGSSASLVSVRLLAAHHASAPLVGICAVTLAWSSGIECELPPMQTLRRVFLSVSVAGQETLGPEGGVAVEYAPAQLRAVEPQVLLLRHGVHEASNVTLAGQALASSTMAPLLALSAGADVCTNVSVSPDGDLARCDALPLGHAMASLPPNGPQTSPIVADILLHECLSAALFAWAADLQLQTSAACAALAAQNPAASAVQVAVRAISRGVTIHSDLVHLTAPSVELPRGGGRITIRGSGLGRPWGSGTTAATVGANTTQQLPPASGPAGDIAAVILHPGNASCGTVVSDGFALTCLAPPGIRPFTSAAVQRVDGSHLALQIAISYVAPRLLGCTPSEIIYAPPGVTLDIQCTGMDLLAAATPTPPAASGSIAGAPCASVSVLSTTQLQCSGVQPALMTATSSASAIRVVIDGVAAQPQASVQLRVAGQPTLSGIRPAVVSAAGGAEITVLGSSLGLGRAADIVNVTVGAAPCTVLQQAASSIACTAPSASAAVGGGPSAGQAAAADVAVFFAGGAASLLPSALTFAFPEVIAVQGGTLAVHDAGSTSRENVTVSGLVLSDGAGGGSMSVAGVSCPALGGVLLVPPPGRSATCSGLLLSNLPRPAPGQVALHRLQVTTASNLTASSAQGAVRLVGPPLLERISPNRARANASITLSGLLLGAGQGDIEHIRIGGVASPALQWLSDAVVVATVPGLENTPTPPDGKLAVQIVLRSGFNSQLQGAFTFESTPRAPLVAPRHLCSYRAADGSARIRFEWSRDRHTRGSPETAFLVEVFNASSAVVVQDTAAGAPSLLALQRRVEVQGGAAGSAVLVPRAEAALEDAPCVIPQTSMAPGSLVWDLQLPDVGSTPAWFRARGGVQSDTGELLLGPPSPLSNALFAQCAASQYLRSDFAAQGRWSLVLCAECPVGATCGGGPWEALGTQAGWSRVPWSKFGLEHRKCFVPDACPPSSPPLFDVGSLAYLRALPRLVADADLDGSSDLSGHHPPAAFHSYAQRAGLQSLLLNATGRSQATQQLPGANQVAPDGSLAAPPASGADTGASGADEQWQQTCREGHTGQLCSKCALGYGRVGTGLCAPCNGTGSSVALLVVFFLALVAALLWVLRGQLRSKGLHKKDHSVIKKVFLNHLQQVALLLSFNLDWPNPLKLTLQVSNSASSAAGDVASPDCLRSVEIPNSPSSAFRLRVLITLGAAPVFVFICLAASTAFVKCTNRNAPVFSALYGRVWLMSVFLVAFLLYSPITRAAMQLFACRDIAGQQRLAEDLSVLCDSRSNNLWRFGLGIPVLLLFSAGFPALLAALLRARRDRLEEEGTRKMLGFFYLGYKPAYYWYEVWVLVRKSAFALILVALSPAGTLWQASCGICVLVCSLVATAWLRPFKKPVFNALDCGSTCLSVLTLAGGVVLVQFDPQLGLGGAAAAAGGLPAQRGITIVLTITNALFVAVLVLWWVREWYVAEAAAKLQTGVRLARRAGGVISAEARKSLRRVSSMSPRSARRARTGSAGAAPLNVENPLRQKEQPGSATDSDLKAVVLAKGGATCASP